MKLLCLLCLGLAWEAAAQNHTIHLRNGDKLQGRLLAIDAAQRIRWLHPHLDKPVEIKGETVESILLAPADAIPPRTAELFVITLGTGETLTGVPVAGTPQSFTVQTTGAGKVTVPRGHIVSLTAADFTPTNGLTAGPTRDFALLRDGTRLTGSISGLRDGQLALTTEYGQLAVPLAKVLLAHLPPRMSPVIRRQTQELDLVLRDHTTLTVTLESWSEKQVVARSQALGRLTLAPEAVALIRYAGQRSLTFKSFIDGRDRVHIRGDALWLVHETWKKPGDGDHSREATFINGQEWWPTWEGNTSSKFRPLSPPFPQGDNWRIKLEKIRARGSLSVSQQPTAANNYEAVIIVDDGNTPAQDWYEFRLVWEPY